jgi:DNA primase
MGTALTDQQVGELGRMAKTALLALDADSAGQDAMLRAFSVAERRSLKLRVAPLPPGLDPAELVQRDGPEGIKTVIDTSIPFVRFRVDRALAKGDLRSAEGRERVALEVAPVFAELQPGTTQMELITVISEQLNLPSSLAERLLQGAAASRKAPQGESDNRRTNGQPVNSSISVSRRDLSRGEDAERAFLALCLAAPEEGAPMLADVDVEQDFSSELLRRAAQHLREVDLRQPMAAAPGEQPALDDDPELKRLLAELVVEAGRDDANPAMLEAQRLQLELARIDRQIQQARGRQSGEVSELAHRKASIKLDFDRAYSRVLEQTGESE